MSDLKIVKRRSYIPSGIFALRTRTLIAAVLAAGLARMAQAIFTWISDAFLIPVCVPEPRSGLLGDLSGVAG